MYPALNAWTFSDEISPVRQLETATRAGFAGIELVVSEAGSLSPDTPAREFVGLARQATEAGLCITSLATSIFWGCNYASPDEPDRQRARDLTLRMLDRAAAAQAGAILVVPADGDRLLVPYAEAMQRTHDALQMLRHEAEARGVALAIENVWNRFLLSPMEMCELIDRINSPYVGAYFDIGNVMTIGVPQDWIGLLGGRIVRVHAKDYDVRQSGRAGFCPLGEGSVDWPAVIAALRAVGYDGPLTYEGEGEPADICRRIKNILVECSSAAWERT